MSIDDRPATDDAESLIGRVASDFFERVQRGEQPRIDEYAKRYPQIADVIEQMFPALGTIGKSAAGDASRAHRDATSQPQQPVPQTIGDFRILGEIGRGGMGIVYEAEQSSMDRKVALKVLPLACMLDEKRLARFKNEVRAAAALNHPNIVAVYSVGEERGIHHYAMRLVRGQSIAQVVEHLRAQQFRLSAESISRAVSASSEGRHATNGEGPDATTDGASHETSATNARPDFYRAVARLGRLAADALHHAHEHGVIHRDIKPANLLLDCEGQIWITDFGLARIEHDAGLTLSGDLLGTVRYMAPEQASGSQAIVDHRADIYALGVTLYELATLRPAVTGNDHREIIEQVTQHEPISPRKLAPSIPVELATIITKAIEKNPADRYTSAAEMADDLGRFLDDVPIKAKPPTLIERAIKWSRRHSDLAWLSVAAMLFGVVGSAAAAFMISRLYREAETQRVRANTQLAETRSARHAADRHRQVLQRELYALNMQQAFDAWNNGRTDEVHDILRRHIPAAREDDLRTFPWYVLQALSSEAPIVVMSGHDGPVREVAVHPDGQRIVSVGDDGTIRTWDATRGDLLGTIDASDHTLNALAISPDGKTVATGYNTLRRWDLASAAYIDRLADFETTIEEAVFSPDGRYLIAGSRDQPAQVIALDNKSIHAIETNTGNESFAITDDGRTVTAASKVDERHRLRSWDMATGKVVRDIAPERGGASLVLATSRPGFTLVASNGNSQIWLQRLSEQEPIGRGVSRIPAKVLDLALSPDESHLVAACSDGMLRVWWLNRTWTPENPLSFLFGRWIAVPAHNGSATSVAFLEDGRAVSCGQDGFIKVWTFMDPRSRDRLQDEQVVRARVSRDASHMLQYMPPDVLQVKSCESGDVNWNVPYQGRWIKAMEFSPDGRKFATAETNQRITVWDRKNRSITVSVHFPEEVAVIDLDFSPNGKWLAATAIDGYTSVWDIDTGDYVFSHKLESWGRAVEFSPDGQLMAVAGNAPDILIVATRSWDIVRRMRGVDYVAALAFHPRLQLLASGHDDATIRVWNPVTGELARTLEGHSAPVRSLAFHPSGKTLISGADLRIRFWDVATWRHLGEQKLPSPMSARQIVFTPDGRTMASLMYNQDTGQSALRTLATSMPAAAPEP